MRTIRSSSVLRWLAAPLALAAALAACGSDPVAPTPQSIAGVYQADSFVAAGADVLAAGGSLQLVFSEDGTVGGLLVIPEEVGGPLDVDMAGTYTLSGDRMSIQQDADTFIRDADWRWIEDDVVRGSWESADGEVRVTVTLRRGP